MPWDGVSYSLLGIIHVKSSTRSSGLNVTWRDGTSPGTDPPVDTSHAPLVPAPLGRALLRHKYPERAGCVSSGQGPSQRRNARGDAVQRRRPPSAQSAQRLVRRTASGMRGFRVVTDNLSVSVPCCSVGITMPVSLTHCTII